MAVFGNPPTMDIEVKSEKLKVKSEDQSTESMVEGWVVRLSFEVKSEKLKVKSQSTDLMVVRVSGKAVFDGT